MSKGFGSTSPLDRRLLLALLTAAATIAACQDDALECERCEFVFYWDSAGSLSDSSETCRELEDCDDAICGLCFDIIYNEEDLPISGTCDSCSEPKDCGLTADLHRRCYYPTHPTECAARGVDLEDCGCYDPNAPGAPCD